MTSPERTKSFEYFSDGRVKNVDLPSFTPHEYQARAIRFIVDNPVCACFLDCGLGKTPITLSAIKKIGQYPVLVVGPKLVVENVWRQEAAKWKEFSDLVFSTVTGTEAQRIKALRTKAHIYLISRDNLVWAKKIGVKFDRYKMIVLDESSSFKNPTAARTKVLFNLPHPRKVLLSATPAPKNLQDLYAQFRILDGGVILGHTLTEFRNRYMYCVNPEKHFWVMRYGADKVIFRDIAPLTVSMRASEYLQMPAINYIPHTVYMNEKETLVYRKMEEDAVLKIISSVGDVEKVRASNAAVLTAKLAQLANGFLYDDNNEPVKLHDHKIEQLEQILDESDIQGERIIAAYQFKADRESILKLADERKYRVADLTTSEGIEAYQKLEFDMAIMHPRSAGMGLNLQKGSRTLVWYSLPWSYEDFYQSISRIYRQGQEKPCFIHFISTAGTVDRNIIQAVNAKKHCDDELKKATKALVKKYVKEEEGN